MNTEPQTAKDMVICPPGRTDMMRAGFTAEYDRLQTWLRERREKIIADEIIRRAPGILDRIQSCESRETASLMWHEFLDGANAVSQKTINKANRLLSTLEFPQA